MGLFDFLKKKKTDVQEKNNDDYAPGWDAITAEFERIYPGQKNPRHYAAHLSYQLGGNDPLQGISVYDAGDSWHFVSYGLSELYEKQSSNKEISGYGMEFTFRLKKGCYDDEESEIECTCGLLQQLARITFQKGERFLPYEYVYSGQTAGIDGKKASKLTGLITIPDFKAQEIETPNGKVMFIEFVGATDEELKAIFNKEIGVKDLYEKLGTDITDYNRNSVTFDKQDVLTNENENLDFSKILNDDDVDKFIKSGQLKWIYVLSPVFGGIEERSNQIIATPDAEKKKQFIDEELQNFLKQGKSVKKVNIHFEYKEKSVVPSKIIVCAIVDGNDYNRVVEIW